MRLSTLLEKTDNAQTTPEVKTRSVGTAQWRPQDRYKLWTDFTRTHSDPIVMPNTPLHDYRVKATLQERGEVSINRQVGDPLGYLRTAKHAANLRADRVRISYCARVDGGIESGGKAGRITDGTVYFRDYRGPGNFWSHAETEETWLFVPRDWFGQSGKFAQDFDGAVLPPGDLLTGVMAQRIEAVATHAEGHGFDQAVTDLRLAIDDVFAARADESHRRSLAKKSERLRRIKAFLARHSADADLTPDRIADSLAISRPTLYRLLKEEGLQVSAYVAEYRLTAIARALRDPVWAGHSIGDIAALWGHLDQAYFGRVFKRRFGLTPNEYRREAIEASRVGFSGFSILAKTTGR